MVKRIIHYLKFFWAKSSSERYCQYLRNNGIKVGTGTHINSRTCSIDITRPSLVSIGNNSFLSGEILP